MSEVHLDRLVGRAVRDARGRVVGRIEEMLAERRGNAWLVTEFRLGPAALLERLSFAGPGATLLLALGGKGPGVLRVPWDRLDLSDPRRPRLLGDADDLERVGGP